jgi:hypothetical protein
LRLRDLKHSLISSDFAIDRTGIDFCKLNSRKRTIFYIPHIQEKQKKNVLCASNEIEDPLNQEKSLRNTHTCFSLITGIENFVDGGNPSLPLLSNCNDMNIIIGVNATLLRRC